MRPAWTTLIEAHWDQLVHLAASVQTGHASAVTALARFGSAARGDPIYDAGVQLGKLLRTAFLADYFVNAGAGLRRGTQQGEGGERTQACDLSRVGAGPGPTCGRDTKAVADALSLLANIVMAWNTAQMPGTGPVGQQATNRAAGADRAHRTDAAGGINLRGSSASRAGALRRPDPAVTNYSEKRVLAAEIDHANRPSRPIGKTTETQGMTSTCAYYWSRPAPILALRARTVTFCTEIKDP